MDFSDSFIFFDTETTGLHPETDEVLELAAIDSNDKVLVNERYRPVHLESWEEASAINGIYPKDVADREPLNLSRNRLKQLFSNQKIVAYNCAFDAAFLGDCVGGAELYCCMNAWTRYYGKRSRLTSAVNCIDPYFFDKYALKAHSALADARACALVWKWLQKNSPEILTEPEVCLSLSRK